MFVQDKITYFDCTNTRSPDGKSLREEWCYIDIHAKEGKDWDYCRPTIDYDKVREKNQSELNVLTVESRKINAELIEYESRAEVEINNLKDVRNGHADLDRQILLIQKTKEALENNLKSYIYNLAKKWSDAEKEAIRLAKIIEDKEKARLKKMAVDAVIKKEKVIFPKDRLTIKSEQVLYNQEISELIEEREKLTDKVNCDGMFSYEHEKNGKGIKGEYFDNETWMGQGKMRLDRKIDFSWNDTPPISGVNAYNFSIRWQGFLKAPFTGKYKFIVETSDSALVTLNDEVIIALNMKSAVAESLTRNTIWLNAEVYLAQHPNIVRDKANSKNIFLIGGHRYK